MFTSQALYSWSHSASAPYPAKKKNLEKGNLKTVQTKGKLEVTLTKVWPTSSML
jgi:hypothetical protein